jgi:hypothetical protein
LDEPELGILAALDRGELGDPLAVVAYLAGQQVDLDEAELNQARRRAMLLLAAGGDPRRALQVDDRAVKALAADLWTEQAGREPPPGLDELALAARDLPRVRDAVLYLVRDVDLAWRLFAVCLIAEELAEG